jgi:hypothetical protein
MSTLELKVYEIFKNRLSEPEAATIIEYIDEKVEKKIEQKKEILATKQDVSELKLEIKENKADTIKWMFIFWVGQLAALITLLKLIK